MNPRRRRANDFTDSLSSFRQTLSDQEWSQAMSQVSSEERSLNSIRNKQDGYNKRSYSKNNTSRTSVILSGNLAQQSVLLSNPCNIAEKNNTEWYNRFLLKDTLSTSDETSYYSLKPDLNKCINLFHNEHMIKEYSFEERSDTLSDTTSNDINPCHLSKNKTVNKPQQDHNNLSRSVSADSLINIVLHNPELRRSKSYTTLDRAVNRDTNYNIKANQFSFPAKTGMKTSCNKNNEKVATIVPLFGALALSKPLTLPTRTTNFSSSEEQSYADSVNNEESSEEELNPSELRTFLYLLADQEPLKETAAQQLRRMSANYYDSPKAFTERLLTIAEESVVNNDSYAQYSNISLSKFNEELRKTCKFIEDETAPAWPQSPGMSKTIGARRKSLKSDLSRKSLGASASPAKSLYTTPVSPRCNIKSPQKIHCRRRSKNITPRNLLHDSTCTFENLEAYCRELFPNEYKTLPEREKNKLQSPARNMDNIRRICESQMASLEDSFDVREQMKEAEAYTSDSEDQRGKTFEEQILQYALSPCEKYDRTNSRRASDKLEQNCTKPGKCQEAIESLEILENSLMHKIAKERQKCFDTVKTLMGIDANSASTKVKKPCPDINVFSPTRNGDEFVETLKCVKKYRNYLEKRKSLLSLFHRARLSSPRTPHDKKDVRAKRTSNENANMVSTCALSTLLGNKPTIRVSRLSPKRKSTSPSSTKRGSTGKTLHVPKSRLFVTPGKKSPVNSGCKPKRTYFPDMLPRTNPGAKTIFREIGNYEHVTSPVGLYIKGVNSPLIKTPRFETEGKLLTSRKQIMRSPSPKIKFRRSSKLPKEPTGTATGGKRVASNFLQPNVHYKFLHMEEENQKVDNRE
ncbi:uncharacterized protein LOC105196883 isoform X2 [Solenopsis invicta]|uniref:uncharacterized protein LOC105196883 isoform X2 n=1 Tax=Solenopsis invicta TaxID=13686 RepID=UPI00193CA638|nr:uncharacterized protein LOC105196883 isoform X2 [Solenopsis invicta]